MGTRPFIVAAAVLVLVCALAIAGLGWPRPARTHPLDGVHEALMAAEDARTDATPLLRALGHPDHDVRRRAVVGLGRFEREGHVPALGRALADPSPLIRAEAANATAQAAYQRGAPQAFDTLRARLAVERVPMVLGAVARAIGRLRHESSAELAAAEAAVLESWSRGLMLAAGDPVLLAPVQLGVALGLDSLSRRGRVRPLGAEAIHVLRGLVSAPPTTRPEIADAVRRARVAAASALVSASAFDAAHIDAAISSDDPQLRRLAAQAFVRTHAPSPAVLDRLRHDDSPLVRLELARAIDQASAPACDLAVSLVADANIHVGLTALDAVAKACVGTPSASRVASDLAGRASDAATVWQVRAHALAAWAKLDGEASRRHLPVASQAAAWQERMYAARAAATAQDAATLGRLAGDPNANVREAALTGLATVNATAAERAAMVALASDDYQLVRTSAGVLAKAHRKDDAARALLVALDRLSKDGRDTARDPRQAILEALRSVGSSEHETAVHPYLRDRDPVIAALAAGVLSGWTGRVTLAAPGPRALRPVPTMDALRGLARASATMRLAGIGEIEFRLLAFEAPTNVARFVEQARAGFFSGLTWHRVEPNFVLQGGSPGANEYSAQGPYTNDEITSASHVRGTVGISTRGRDTGDGQLFINLADNIRLDHNFTIIGEIVRGLDVMDAVVEGTTIEEVVVAP